MLVSCNTKGVLMVPNPEIGKEYEVEESGSPTVRVCVNNLVPPPADQIWPASSDDGTKPHTYPMIDQIVVTFLDGPKKDQQETISSTKLCEIHRPK